MVDADARAKAGPDLYTHTSPGPMMPYMYKGNTRRRAGKDGRQRWGEASHEKNGIHQGGGKPRKEWKTPGGAQATRQQWVAGQDRVHWRKQETLVAPPTDGLDVPTGAGMAAAAAPRAQASTTTWRAAASPTGGAGGGSGRGRHGESVDPAGGTRAAAAGRRQRPSASAGAWASAGVGVPSAAPSMVDVRAGGCTRRSRVEKDTGWTTQSSGG